MAIVDVVQQAAQNTLVLINRNKLSFLEAAHVFCRLVQLDTGGSNPLRNSLRPVR
jgi:hypothetical protein